ncbi:glutathione peroxidase [Paenibacillus shirakamiensis]|nr:glutathione peroxidase [Paenibacillus shirakamiensis]
MSIYSFHAHNIRGKEVPMSQFKDQVLLIVNTASKCGLTPQYSDLQKLYEKYKDQGFTILGFPSNQFGEQEPGSNDEINTFCQLNYGVTFPLFEKVDVRGSSKHPLFAYLTEQKPFTQFDLSNSGAKLLKAFIEDKQPDLMLGDDIKWNFTKFLVNAQGEVVERFESPVDPVDMETAIEKWLSVK